MLISSLIEAVAYVIDKEISYLIGHVEDKKKIVCETTLTRTKPKRQRHMEKKKNLNGI